MISEVAWYAGEIRIHLEYPEIPRSLDERCPRPVPK